MQLPAQNFTALIQSLGLVPGLFKPSPGLTASSISNNSSPYAQSNADLNNYANDQASHYYQDAASCDPEPYYAPPVTDQDFPPFDSAKATIYRYRQQQSVNLGSWFVISLLPVCIAFSQCFSRFVHENWMSPSIFECASGSKLSELDIAYGWNSVQGARAVLEQHWDTWITQSDFDQLASIGINTVRLPIGYWSLGPDFCRGTAFDQVADVYQGSWSRVVRAINMAGKVGIGVLVDLHGAIGSQNGQGHSGVSDGKTNLFYDEGNIAKTIDVLKFLIQQLGTVTNVVGIQMLNEPLNIPELTPFCKSIVARHINRADNHRQSCYRCHEEGITSGSELPALSPRRVQSLEVQSLYREQDGLCRSRLSFLLCFHSRRRTRTCISTHRRRPRLHIKQPRPSLLQRASKPCGGRVVLCSHGPVSCYRIGSRRS